jgi:hypothetical protein
MLHVKISFASYLVKCNTLQDFVSSSEGCTVLTHPNNIKSIKQKTLEVKAGLIIEAKAEENKQTRPGIDAALY